MKRRRFTPEFKRSIIEQLLREAAGPAEICRRYNLSSGQLYTWKKQYAQDHFEPEPSKAAELSARVAELERMLGEVTLENEYLIKAVRNTLKQTQKKESSLPKIAPLSKAFQRGCELMQIPKRTYHYQPKQKPLEKALKARIEDLCLQYPKYGYRRVTKQLQMNMSKSSNSTALPSVRAAKAIPMTMPLPRAFSKPLRQKKYTCGNTGQWLIFNAAFPILLRRSTITNGCIQQLDIGLLVNMKC